jgi:hypothetical protein
MFSWVAVTGTGPIDDELVGTVKLARNPPLALGITVDGVVLTSVVLNLIVTGEIVENPIPVIFTEAPTGPEVGLSAMVGLTVLPDVEKFHSQLSSTPFESKQSKKLPFWSSILDDIDAM